MIVNFCGGCREDYREVAARLDGVEGVHALEMNISCPNLDLGGLSIGQDPAEVHRAVALARVVGSLSGLAIRPVAVRMVWQVRQALQIPIVGCGGIWTARDALEFILAGAAAVQLGTVNFTHPARWVEVLAGIEDYCVRHGVERVTDPVGALR